MPVVLQLLPPSVDWKIWWLSVFSWVFVARNTSFGLPPASHGRSPSWQFGLPRSHVLPPSWEENSESFARSMPVLYIRPLSSTVRSGSLNPADFVGSALKPATPVRCQLAPSSSEVQMFTWLR